MDSTSYPTPSKAAAVNTIELVKEIMALRADLLIVSHPHAKQVISVKLATLETLLIGAN